MKVDELLEKYKTISVLADVIGVSRATIYKWIDVGHIPAKRQILIEKLTNGEFKASLDDLGVKR